MGAGWSQGDISTYLSQVSVKGDANMLEVGKDGVLKVYELKGDGKCNPLPGKIELSSRAKELEQKRMFITTPGDKRNLRLYNDNECDIRANEETYMKKTTLNNQNIIHFTANYEQNARYYKIEDTEPNKPSLPYFMVNPSENARKRIASERAIRDCLPIPYMNSSENFNATVNKDAAFQRELSNVTLYTDSECTNIYTQTQEEIDYANNSYYPYSTTTNAYTSVKGYGGRVMDKTNARYYKIKDEKWNVINDIDPVKLARATALREERARLKIEKEEREKKEAMQRLVDSEERARVQALSEKRAALAAEQVKVEAANKALRDAAERARIDATQRALIAKQEEQRRSDKIAADLAASIMKRQQENSQAMLKQMNDAQQRIRSMFGNNNNFFRF
jgi:hypothetical protein